MTTGIPTQPLTAAAFLFGDSEQDSVDALAHALREHGVLGTLGEGVAKLSRAGRNAANDQVATVAHGLLDLDLGGLVIAAWGKYADLMAAAKRTFATPDSSEVVELATHTITSAHRPYVELLVNDAHVATVHFELAVKFVVKALVATVQHGRLVAVHSGDCDVTATLAAESRQLAKREAHLQLPLLARLDGGIPLLHDIEAPPAAVSVQFEGEDQLSLVGQRPPGPPVHPRPSKPESQPEPEPEPDSSTS
ncbi:MAG TPA: hypothetical protein VFA45_24500 [Actinomycetes bacterium]|jgi:hypothetical protein|nr:hypothetical protein [Actinomycetes bacterium]